MRHGSHIDPPNRFENIRRERDLEQVEWDDEYLREIDSRKIEYLEDGSKTIVSENNSARSAVSLQHQSVSRVRSRLLLIAMPGPRTSTWASTRGSISRPRLW